MLLRININHYSGCHKYIPFARFPNRRKYSVLHPEIITNMTTARIFFIKKNLNFYATMCHISIN